MRIRNRNRIESSDTETQFSLLCSPFYRFVPQFHTNWDTSNPFSIKDQRNPLTSPCFHVSTSNFEEHSGHSETKFPWIVVFLHSVRYSFHWHTHSRIAKSLLSSTKWRRFGFHVSPIHNTFDGVFGRFSGLSSNHNHTTSFDSKRTSIDSSRKPLASPAVRRVDSAPFLVIPRFSAAKQLECHGFVAEISGKKHPLLPFVGPRFRDGIFYRSPIWREIDRIFGVGIGDCVSI